MCLGFESIAMNLCFVGLKIIEEYLKKTQNPKKQNPFERTLLAMKSPCKLDFNASNFRILKNTIHKVENNPLFFDCSHQLVLTNMFETNLKGIFKMYSTQSRVTALRAHFH